MRAAKSFCIAFIATVACGGTAVIDQPMVSSQPPSSAGAGGALAGSPPNDQIQIVDDVDHSGGQYPPVPPGAMSGAFFWKGGLGNWFVSLSDGSSRDASSDDVIPPRGDSHKAYHVTETKPGTVVDVWAQLNHPQGAAVDLSSYAGISFWARMNGPPGELTVAFGANGRLSNVNVMASWPHKSVALSETWTQFVVLFDDVNLNPKSASSIDLVVGGRSEPLDLWLDDLGFVCQGSCP